MNKFNLAEEYEEYLNHAARSLPLIIVTKGLLYILIVLEQIRDKIK